MKKSLLWFQIFRVSSSKHAEDTMNILRRSEYANIVNFDLEVLADYCRGL